MTNAMKKYDTIPSNIEELCGRMDAVDASFKFTRDNSDALGEVKKMILKLASLEEVAQLKERANASSMKYQTYVPYPEFSRLKEENATVISRVSFLEKGSSFKREPVSDSSVHSLTAFDGSNFQVQELRCDLESIRGAINREIGDDVLVRRNEVFSHVSHPVAPLSAAIAECVEDIKGKEEKRRRWEKRGICSFWW